MSSTSTQNIKKVLYITQYFYPENTAGSIRAENVLKLLKENKDITVFTTYPNHPMGKVDIGYSNSLLSKDTVFNTTILRSRIIPLKNINYLNRFITYISFLFFGLINLLANKAEIGDDYDAIYCSSGPFFAGYLGYCVAKSYKADFNVEFRDIIFVLQKEGSLKYKLIKSVELFLCKKAKKIVVSTESFKSTLIKNGICKDKITVVPNIINTRCGNKYFSNISNRRMIFLYLGNVGLAQNISELVCSFMSINNSALLKVVGDGAKQNDVRQCIRNRSKKLNITYSGSVDYIKRVDEYKEASFVIVKLGSNSGYSNYVPSKLYDAMSYGKAIIYIGPRGEASGLIESTGCGLAFQNSNDFAQYFNKIVDINELNRSIKRMGEKGYRYINDHKRCEYECFFKNL